MGQLSAEVCSFHSWKRVGSRHKANSRATRQKLSTAGCYRMAAASKKRGVGSCGNVIQPSAVSSTSASPSAMVPPLSFSSLQTTALHTISVDNNVKPSVSGTCAHQDTDSRANAIFRSRLQPSRTDASYLKSAEHQYALW
jgi:hypothetical protein